ncbi:hydroxy-delta-5-steroid dehydrogenase, 3 beta- and steroid delta-isomerase 1 [Salvelinus alpinus]|uniref:Hydroxy-delta-5-steroid dehydrogenase, 3 beta- and steroid delta-isomerase 1 n=2 Tax=Salvelinus TaxID=8033 RepID=A0A8U1C6S2_SALNM|nr:3 beta-hydroxysteroid dehydrogenase/Delta 5-->4-isomerase [Salvelinus alpinus]XP_038862999.1 hydroxy-delta-5-steroid dehydrogenase, 3 beta- and steroid delta-isomerase 1 [Salvelinus namaycush]XP_055734140.1 hydroxy-delta-5-steroid dehydrogenase, 3 beta- and steroid delta-isomerase 1 [Salvelinus fontinalis]
MSLQGDVCVVTGACGFLGERLVRLLLEEDKLTEIRMLDIHVRPQLIQCLEEIRGDTLVSVFEGDISDSELLRRACKGASLVFHTASLIDVTGKVVYSELHRVNVKGTQLLLETCVQENVVSFIYTSSIEVAGPNANGDPIINGDENTPYTCSLKFPYSKTKKEAEQVTLQAQGEVLQNGGRLATCALRPMYIYGEGCRFLLGHMGDGIRNGDMLYRTSRPEAQVNPVYVGNAALAHLQAARALRDPQRRAAIGGNFYYISDDTPPVSYSDFNHAVLSPLGFSIQEKPILPIPVLYLFCFLMEMLQILLCPFKRFTPPINRQLLTMLNTPFSFSYRRAQRDMGYAPRYSWEEARKRTMDWVASQLPKERERSKAK